MLETKEPVMKKNRQFRVYVKDKFEAIFDTIHEARVCRKALQRLNYENIVIQVTDSDVNPYEK